MPNKKSKSSRITAVPVDQPQPSPPRGVEEGLARAWDSSPVGDGEQQTEAQEMTEIINEVKETPAEQVDEPVGVDEPVAAEPKAKPKRAPKPKPSVTEVTPALNEITVKVEIPTEANKDATASQKVSCPDCGKQMSAKTLKYSHAPNCLAKKQKVAHEEGSRGGEEPVASSTITDEMIEHEIEKRMANKRVERLNKRQKDLEKLVAGAF